MIIKFCSDCSECPVIDIQENHVIIGEEDSENKDNKVKLTKNQWNDLIKKIKEDY